MQDDMACQIAFSAYLAENLRKLRTTIEIRSYRRIYDRIEVWVSLFGLESLEEGSLKMIAQQMGVSPAAFYREFAKWKKARC